MPNRATIITALPVAAVFLAAGGLTRFMLRAVESRLQIVFFVLLALLFESTRRRAGQSPSLIRFTLDSAAAAAAIIAVKWHIEGLPYYLGSFALAQ